MNSNDKQPETSALLRHMPPQFRLGHSAAREEAAQLAIDQQSDDPLPGDWNEACRHIAKLIRESVSNG